MLALRDDGTLVDWGPVGTTPPSIPTGLSGVKSIAPLRSGSGGGAGFIVIKNDGSVVAFGDDWFGNTKVPKSLAVVIAVAAEADNSSSVVLALHADGTVTGWGSHDFSVTTPAVTSLARWTRQFHGATAIAASFNSFAVADGSGKVVWQDGRSGGSVAIKDVVQLAVGGCYGLALTKSGTVTGWTGGCTGDLGLIQAAATPPAGLSGVIEICAVGDTGVALKADGTAVVWGWPIGNFVLPTNP